MAQVRLSMRKIEEILRLKYESGLSHRAIGQRCHPLTDRFAPVWVIAMARKT